MAGVWERCFDEGRRQPCPAVAADLHGATFCGECLRGSEKPESVPAQARLRLIGLRMLRSCCHLEYSMQSQISRTSIEEHFVVCL